MFFRFLKNDLRKKKAMNVILLVIVIMASMFMASGLNNVMTVMNGTDHFFDLAGLGDYIVFSQGEEAKDSLRSQLDQTEAVKGYRMEESLLTAPDIIRAADGTKLETKNASVIQSVDRLKSGLFDMDNRRITEVEKGHAYISGAFIEKNGFQPGDTVLFCYEKMSFPLILSGKMKDALFGSDLMGNSRIVLNEEDYRTILSNTSLQKHTGQIFNIDTDDVRAVELALSEAEGMVFNESRATIRMTCVMDLILAIVTLILSVCLTVVSFVMLRFCITFHIMEEYREIGVMKAIGIGSRRIRNLYLAKYAVLALAGALVGFACSIPFGKLLMHSVSGNMVLENDYGIRFHAFGSSLIVLATVWFAWICTGRVKKASPLDAVRSGQTGERFEKKRGCRLGKSHLGSIGYLAVNDILSSPRRYLSMLITFCICTLLVLILENTTATMNSDRLINTFVTKSDLYLSDYSTLVNSMSASDAGFEQQLEQIEQKLKDAGLEAKACVELQYKYPVTFKGNQYKISFMQGLGVDMEDYKVSRGSLPQQENEILLTPQISEMTGAKIGDTVTVHFPSGDMDCMVSGYFQSMCLLGKVAHFHTDAPTDPAHISSALAFQLRFTDHEKNTDLEEDVLEERKERVKKLFGTDKVMTAAEYCRDCVAVCDTLEAVKYLLLGITFVVIFLVTSLMERTFISDERAQIALLKAMGFKEGRIVLWHVLRLAIVGFAAAVLAAALSGPVTKLCISPLFAMMGADKVTFLIRPWKIFAFYPLCILVFTMLAGLLQALYTVKIRSRDTANIE